MNKMNIKRLIAILLCVAIFITSNPIVYAGSIPSKYNDYIVDGRVDYKKLHIAYFEKNILPYNLIAPTSSFTVTVNHEGKSTAYNSDSDNIVYAQIGDTFTISNTSTPGSGSGLSKCDFQISDGTSIIYSTTSLGSVSLNNINTNEKGIYSIYLNVMDNEDMTKTEGWGNWAYNGSHVSPGTNPGGGTGSDFPGWWYYSKLTIDIRAPEYTLEEKHIDRTTGRVLYDELHKNITEDTKTTQAKTFSGYKFIASREGYTWDELLNCPDGTQTSRTAHFSNTRPNAFHYYYYEPLPGLHPNFAIKYSGTDYTDKELTVPNLPISVNLTDLSVGENITSWTWKYKTEGMSSFETFSAAQNPTKELDAEKTYTFRLTVKNAIEEKSVEHSVTVKKDTPSGPTDRPPIAVIDDPSNRMAGENASFSGAGSIAYDGKKIESLIWEVPGANINIQYGKTISVWYPHEGEYDVSLTVVDSAGLTGECMTSIRITPPIPKANIDITGTFKENRKVTISGSNSSSPTHYPINKYIWTMTNGADAKYMGTFGNDISKDMILKKAQSYRFDLKVDNTYGLSDTEFKSVTIVPDVAPIADFTIPSQVLRNKNDSGNATITVTNLSKSTDGDTIKKTVLFYAYDSDNDGNFDEETWYYSMDGTTWTYSGLSYTNLNNLDLYNLSGASNPTNFVLKTKNVGKYKFEAKTIEDIPASDTIPSLLSASDYKTGITTTLKPVSAKVCEVINVAPTVGFSIKKTKPVDIFIFTDYTGTKLNGLSSVIASKTAQLSAIGVDPKFIVVNTSKTIGSQSLKKYRYFRNFHFDVKVTSGDGTNNSWTEYNPKYIDEGGLWEEKQSYEKPINEIPFGRNYSWYQYINTTSSSGSYDATTRNYKVYDTAGGYENVGFTTEYYSNTGWYYRYLTWAITGVYVDPEWTRDALISTDNFNVTTIDLDAIKTLSLRSGSDRYAIFLSDGKSKDYSAAYGNNFAFGALTTDLNNYINQNNFRIYTVADPKAMNTLISKEIGIDVQATTMVNGNPLAFYETSNGYYYFNNYNVDSSIFGDVQSIMYPGLVKMKNGTTKVFNGTSFKTLPINNVITAGSGNYLSVVSSNTLSFLDSTTMQVSSTFNIPNIKNVYPKNGLTGWYDTNGNSCSGIFAITNIGLHAIKDTNSDGLPDTLQTLTKFSSYSISKMYDFNNILTSTGQLLSYNIQNDIITTKYTNVKDISYGGSSCTSTQTNTSCCVGGSTLILFQDGTLKAQYPIVTGQRWSKKQESYINDYGISTYTVTMTGGVGIKQISASPLGMYMLGTDSNVYKINYTLAYSSVAAQAPVVSLYLSSVTNITEYFTYNSLYDVYFIKPDGFVRRYTNQWTSYQGSVNIYSTTVSGAKKAAVAGYNSYYILKTDGTSSSSTGSGYIVSNITMTNPTASYITLNDLINNNYDSMTYGAGQYSQALNHMVSRYTADPSYSTNCILLGDTVNYNVFYQDTENDPKYKEYWTYNHNQYYFDNPLGSLSVNGQTINYPVTAFDKTGRVNIDLKIRDNPEDYDRFDNYRLPNQGIVNAFLYVHRKPVALQRITVANNGNGTYTVKALDAGSYDLDHSISRADKGIVAGEWRWKESTETNWHYGQMNKPDCTADKSYIIQLRVQDIEGAWSDYNTIEIDKDNPPVALFTIDKPVIATTERLKVKDQSYPQSFSTITRWNWVVKKLNADGSVPSADIQNGTYGTRNNGTGAMAGYDVNVRTDYSTSGVGKYRIYLRVKNSDGLWSDGGTDAAPNLNNFYRQDFEVDSPPTASFTIEKNPINIEETLKLKDQSTATGISSLAKWHWIVKKLNQDGSIPSSNIQDAKFTNSNNGTGTMAGYDINVKTLYADKGAGKYRIYLRVMNGNGMWSDGGTESSYNLNSMYYMDLTVNQALKIDDLSVQGRWNHFRGWTDKFGVWKDVMKDTTYTDEKGVSRYPYRFLSYEKIDITIKLGGYADKVIIDFPDGLGSMTYTDKLGYTYSYRHDVGYTVSFPYEIAVNPTLKDPVITWSYILPLVNSSASWENTRLKQPYTIAIKAVKDSYDITQTKKIDITGNVDDLIFIQPAER